MAAIGRFQKGDDTFYAKVVDGKLYKLKGDVFGSPSYAKRAVTPTRGIRTLTPVEPSKIIAVGLNYADHARESNLKPPTQPLFWLKAPTSLLPDGGKIDLPFPSHRNDFEAELAIVIGRRIRNVSPQAASRYILATQRRRILVTAISNAAKVSGRALRVLTASRRLVRILKRKLIHRNKPSNFSKMVSSARIPIPAR